MTIKSKYHPSQLPLWTDLPENLRPTLSKIYSYKAQAATLSKTADRWATALAELRKEREEVKRKSLELEASLMESLGMIQKVSRKKSPAEEPEEEVKISEIAKALRQLGEQERENLMTDLFKTYSNKEVKE